MCSVFLPRSGEALPAAGFGFGDAVIVELLSDRGLLPKETGPGVTAVVFGWDDELQVRLPLCLAGVFHLVNEKEGFLTPLFYAQ